MGLAGLNALYGEFDQVESVDRQVIDRSILFVLATLHHTTSDIFSD